MLKATADFVVFRFYVVSLYKKFGNLKIFRTNIYTISNNEIKLDKNRYVYYLVEDNIVYYLGMDFKENDLNIYLFNR